MEATRDLAELGAEVAGTAADAARRAAIVVTMVTDADAVMSFARGQGCLLLWLRARSGPRGMAGSSRTSVGLSGCLGTRCYAILCFMADWPRLMGQMDGELVTVEPLAWEHERGLFQAGHDRDMWRYLSAFPNAFETPERFHHWMQEALAATAAGDEGAWAIIDRATARPIGSTRYLALRPVHRSLEVGWTWLGRPWWRTGANMETKLLLFNRAFEQLGCRRVELKTDARNMRSRKALEALPAQFEGIHRCHLALPDGGWRDTAWYSVIAPEWPDVRGQLRHRLAQHGLTSYAKHGDGEPPAE